MSSAAPLIGRINKEIILPLIHLLEAAALVYFAWGLYQFIAHADSEEGRSDGKRHIMWGLIGFLIIFSVEGILWVSANTFDINLPSTFP